MAETFQTYRRRIRSVKSTAKITRAMELVAASRIVRARQRVEASTPYAKEITKAVSEAASNRSVTHPMLTEADEPRRAAILLITADRGFAGAYNANVLKEGEALSGLLDEQGKEVVSYVTGTKGINWFNFRRRPYARSWSGFSEQPRYEDAREVGQTLIDAFLQPTDDGGVDEIHMIYTEFVSMLTQAPDVRRILPLELEEAEEEQQQQSEETGPSPLYEFEPSAEEVLDTLLPRYINARVYNAMLQAAASEQAARQRAMKSATDNANELVEKYTRLQNQARQAQITQEISEIVGGANALAESTAGSE
ncbi:MAG: F0F1 ATP synthase subunit gamma [Streptosporangiales bacterium]|nr:F0F1 ATP synthase subunit gamma [Streptosporangiales bacterium]MBO0889972.1 F0F1 ATP synthase subunit gamma [Acidothermales bacterium]